jgi:hypothetical protein
MGRWQSRDPLGEYAGLNCCGFVNNHAVNNVDPLGLKEYSKASCESELQDAINSDRALKELVDQLKKAKRKRDGEPCLKHIFCSCCYEEDGSFGLFLPENSYEWGYGVRICYQKTDNATRTLLHELQHSAEECFLDKEKDCKEAACAEARARYCAGMDPQAAKNEAYLSAREWGQCKGKSDQEITALAQGCELNKSACYVPRPEKTSCASCRK